MASSSAPVHPYRYLTLFLVLLIGAYLLVFLTGDKQAKPKLGIDLQGGTRVTLTARTPDGSAPTREALAQAQEIISSRVDGLGVSGSEVVIDGQNLVITVPGNDGNEARNLGQTARLYIRPVIHVIPAQGQAPPGQAPPGAPPGAPGAPRRPSSTWRARAAGRTGGTGRTGDATPRRARRAAGADHSAHSCRTAGRSARARGARTPAPALSGGAPGADACAVTGTRRTRPSARRPRARAGPREPRAAEARRAEARPGAADLRREGTAAEHGSADSGAGVAVPGHPLRRRGRAGRQRRPQPAAGDLFAGSHPGVSAGQVDHQR